MLYDEKGWLPKNWYAKYSKNAKKWYYYMQINENKICNPIIMRPTNDMNIIIIKKISNIDNLYYFMYRPEFKNKRIFKDTREINVEFTIIESMCIDNSILYIV